MNLLTEYAHLLDTTYATFADEPGRGARVRALIQLMRYSGFISLSPPGRKQACTLWCPFHLPWQKKF